MTAIEAIPAIPAVDTMGRNGSKTAVRIISQRYSVVAFWQYAPSGVAPKLPSTNLSVRFFPFCEATLSRATRKI